MTNARFDALFAPRRAGRAVEPARHGPARSVQEVTEEAVMRLARAAWKRASATCAWRRSPHCVANGRLLREGPFERIDPARRDAGGRVGVALSVCHAMLTRRPAWRGASGTAIP